jgi:hypothetical protein
VSFSHGVDSSSWLLVVQQYFLRATFLVVPTENWSAWWDSNKLLPVIMMSTFFTLRVEDCYTYHNSEYNGLVGRAPGTILSEEASLHIHAGMKGIYVYL